MLGVLAHMFRLTTAEVYAFVRHVHFLAAAPHDVTDSGTLQSEDERQLPKSFALLLAPPDLRVACRIALTSDATAPNLPVGIRDALQTAEFVEELDESVGVEQPDAGK
jgi:hypothetical protein